MNAELPAAFVFSGFFVSFPPARVGFTILEDE